MKPSRIGDRKPADAGMVFMGGAAGLVFTTEEFFIEKPLMLISTWDGDEFSLTTYVQSLKNFEAEKSVNQNRVSLFEEKIKKLLNQQTQIEYEIEKVGA